MNKLYGPVSVMALMGLAMLGGCSSSNVATSSGASPASLGGTAPMIYVQSARQPDDITRCLQGHASSLRVANLGGAIQLGDGLEWLITLTPSRGGSTVAVQRAMNASEQIPEPEMRFDIARCTT
ncbi:sugar ABC transporter ATPase [Pararobbsia silviterrae]|nr:sugar ABC transporter ATPase [Pararobbsia silviterrae]